MNRLLEWIFHLTMAAIIITITVAFANYVIVPVFDWQCEKKAGMMNMKHNFEFGSGCMVRFNDRWVPINSVIFNVPAKKG